MAVHHITPVFVEFIPENIEQGKLYISETYKTAIHKCCCGCGEEVVTPLSPADWQLKKGANTVSLYPSVGNWNYKCKSHYFINNNRIIWAPKFSPEQIESVQVRDRVDKLNYIADKNKADPTTWSNFIDWLVKSWRFIRSLFSLR